MENIIGVLSNNNINHNIYYSTIKNPYCIYLPVIQNNKIIKYVHIDEKIITSFLYTNFINNIYIGHISDYNHKRDSFINWIYNFNDVNKSNWYVIIHNMFKNNILN